MNKHNTLVKGLLVLALALVAVSFAAALPNSPYNDLAIRGNVIGSAYQANTIYTYNFAYNRHFYDYVAPARAGGFYGSGTAFITNLRTPVYAPVPPVHYTNYYQPVCSWPYCYLGGAGFPRARSSQFPLALSPGGALA